MLLYSPQSPTTGDGVSPKPWIVCHGSSKNSSSNGNINSIRDNTNSSRDIIIQLLKMTSNNNHINNNNNDDSNIFLRIIVITVIVIRTIITMRITDF